MSDFGAVLEYALMLEGSIPAGEAAKYEVVRPAVMGLTKRQKEEREKLAVMTPEDRQKAEAEIAKKREEDRAKFEEEARKRQEQADAQARQQAQQQAQQPKPQPAAEPKR